MMPGHWQQIHGMGNSNLFMQQATAAKPGTPHSAFRASYLPAQHATAALADPSTLAVFGFNAGPTPHDAPHWLQVPLAKARPWLDRKPRLSASKLPTG